MMKQVMVITKTNPKDLRRETKELHKQTLREIHHFLKTLPCNTKVLDRNDLCKKIQADLIIAVGGDGTVLAASHFAGKTPILGINSAPQTSTGFFCLAHAGNYQKHVQEILKQKRKPILIPRIAIILNGNKLPFLALNEVLFSSKSQAETARYRIRIGPSEEIHKSSGVWVATGAGSTAAIYSAGGKKDSPFSKRIQYLVREPFRFPKNHYRLLQGFLTPKQKLTLTSEMNQGHLFIDGAKLIFRVPKYKSVILHGGAEPLKIFLL